MIDLDALEALAKAATPGPWGHYGHRPHINVPDEVRAEDGTVIVTVHNDCDAAFIAAANPDVVLELIAELRVKNNLHEVNEWTEELEKNALRNELKRARAERDWLAGVLERTAQAWIMGKIKPFCPSEVCHQRADQKNCVNCWLEAAREAVEEKK